MNSFYIHDQEKQQGPFELSQIKSMWDHGVLTANAQYFDETAQDWKPISGLLASVPPSSEIGIAPTIAPKTNTKKSDGHPKEVTCPHCGVLWELNDTESRRSEFTCSECNQTFLIPRQETKRPSLPARPIEGKTAPKESVQHIVVNTNIKQGAAIGGWVCFILGIVIMYFSLWTFILYVPLLFVAFILSVIGMVQGRILLGITLLLLTIIEPPIEWLVLAATRGDKFAQKYIPGYTEERMIDKQIIQQATSPEQPTPPVVALSEQAPSPQETPSPEPTASTDQPTAPEQNNAPQPTPTVAPSQQGEASQPTPPPFLSMEANTNNQIVPLTGLTAPIVYELKAPTPTQRESIAQAMLGYYYRDNMDEFSKRKFLQKLDSLIAKRVAEAKPSDLYSVDENVNLGEYNFYSKGFPTGNFNQEDIPLPDVANGSFQASMTNYFVRSTDSNQLKFVAIDPKNAESLGPGLSQSREATINYMGTLGGTGVLDPSRKVIYLNVRKITITLSRTTESGQTKLYQVSEVFGAEPLSNTMNSNQTSQGGASDTGAPVTSPAPLPVFSVDSLNLQQVRDAINTIYARHGVEFPKQDVQDWADKQPWYHRVPYKTSDMAEQEFTADEKANVELLAARRDALRNVNTSNATSTPLPDSTPAPAITPAEPDQAAAPEVFQTNPTGAPVDSTPLLRPENIVENILNNNLLIMAANFRSQYSGKTVRYTGVVVRKNSKEELLVFKGGGFLTTAYDVQVALRDGAKPGFNDVGLGDRITIIGTLDRLVPPPFGVGSNSIRLDDAQIYKSRH